MQKILLLSALIISFVFAVSAQKLEKPKLTPRSPTAAQDGLIREGIALHDAKKYDDAIRKYETVLEQNPDCTLAMYEMALSLYNKPDRAKADAIARRGAQYKSEQIALFYAIIASGLDDSGKSQDAIEVFKDAAKFLKGDKNLSSQLAEVNYNLGVTYFRRKEYTEARAALKEGIEANFRHPGATYLLAEVYSGTRYKIPALLAASRFMGFEQPNAARTKRAADIVMDLLKKPEKDEKTGNINILLDLGAPKDEGDFGIYEMLGSISGITTDEDKKENKTENELFADSLSSLIAMLAEDKKLRSTFVGKTFIPYLDAMKKAGHHETLAYLILQEAGNTDATKWMSINPRRVSEYFEWAKAYQLPAK